MIFITGPLYAGKQEYICSALGWSNADFSLYGVRDVQDLALNAIDLSVLADALSTEYQVVIATELGGGVVPIDTTERAKREAAGRLACLLSERADVVIRVCCGLPQVLKGQLPQQ